MPVTLSKARALYDSGAPVAHVAAALGLNADAFRRLRKKHGWPLRPSPIVRRPAASAPSTPPARKRGPPSKDEEAGAVNVARLRRQVEQATQSELAKVQKTLASGKTEDIERNARLLASLVKSLAELRRLEALDPLGGADAPGVEGQDEERPPRDLETLRDELARALERMSCEPGASRAGE